ncbi:MAG: 2-oxo acid dehydrogenase subunit E2 [Ichthyobacteriaceae bacterium]|nr:2-oxo acid dehydrogenase subunit E2 [Ichthyobacteriaceae bacterium]
MALVELLMPKMGESVAEATVVNWQKQEGDNITVDDIVVEIATDKVDSEIPSEIDGVLVKQLFKIDEVVKVGEAIAIIETNSDEVDVKLPFENKSTIDNVSNVTDLLIEKAEQTKQVLDTSLSERFYSPLVRSIAKEENILFEELETIKGTGKENRVTKDDIKFYILLRNEKKNKGIEQELEQKTVQKNSSIKANLSEPVLQEIKQTSVSFSGDDEIIEMDRMRKKIAEHMIMSKQISAHVTSFVEADVTRIVKWRDNIKDEFLQREGEKITYTPIILEAVAKAIKDFPMVNVSLDGDKIIKRGNINIGMATALPSGNLIVPVIKNADTQNLLGLTKQVNKMAVKARSNNLSPDDIAGGTYTVTNIGTFGNIMGTPIINQPQVAILAIGAIRKIPAVVETPEGDVIAIRHKMYLSHSYDHRIVDGALGGMFVKRVADYLEAFDMDKKI